jgi:hypothetical protein
MGPTEVLFLLVMDDTHMHTLICVFIPFANTIISPARLSFLNLKPQCHDSLLYQVTDASKQLQTNKSM